MRSSSATWMAALVVSFGCGGGGHPPAPVPDASPPRDASHDASVDANDASTDGAMGTDTGIPDAGVPNGCTIDYETELTRVGRETDITAPRHIRTEHSDTVLAAIFADDADGTRRVRIVTAAVSGAAGVVRSDLTAVPDGARFPDILRVGSTWLVAYVTPAGGVVVQPLSDDFSANGSAVEVAAAGSHPVLARVGSGAFVAWAEGTALSGQALSSDGNRVGSTVSLGSLVTAEVPFDINSFGTEGKALVVVGGVRGGPARATSRVVESTGAAAAMSTDVGATVETEGDIHVGDVTPVTPPTLLPLLGASTFGVRVAGEFGEIRFILLRANGSPEFDEFTVSEHGESSWGSSVTEFQSGYVVAYRAIPMEGGFPRIRLGFMARDSCRLGRVDSWMTAGVLESERGTGTEITAADTSLLVAWAETLTDAIDYHVAIIRCRSL